MPGPQELLIIAVVALLVFGPDRLPEVARNAARFIGRVRSETSRSVDELKRAAELEGLDREWKDISAELRGARDDLRRPLSQVRDTVRDPVDGRMPPTTSVRPDDRPPPVDAEAT